MAVNVSRSTPLYNVPPSQNTAPVLEFRCLYTHDFFKKQKKWHDGTLKFHTFNRRVMVYDDLKNFIGDLHYRQEEDIGEGVELQLDRGVKVEIGEPLGQTQTDLTPLLDKVASGRDHGAASTPNASTRVVKRLNATNSQGRPKSLSEVLGSSQGRVGRAKLPLQSPYEQRQTLADAQHNGPPAKRQRIAAGKENIALSHGLQKEVTTQSPGQDQGQQVRARQREVQVAPPSRPSKTPTNDAIIGIEVFEVSSDEDVRVRSSAKATSKKSRARSVVTPPDPDEGVPNHSLRFSAEKLQNVGRRKTPSPSAFLEPATSNMRESRSVKRGPVQPSSHSFDICKNLDLSLKRGMVSLKMVTQQPRRKLMYNPHSRSSTIPSNKQNDLVVPPRSHEASAVPQKNSEQDSGHDSTGDETDLEQIMSDIIHEDLNDTERGTNLNLASSPMFFSQNSSQNRLLTPDLDDIDTGGFISTQCNVGDARLTPEQSPKMNSVPVLASPDKSQAPLARTSTRTPERKLEARQALDQASKSVTRLIPNDTPAGSSLTARRLSSARSRSFRRVVSENDSPVLAPRTGEAVVNPDPLHDSPVRATPSRLANAAFQDRTSRQSPLKQSLQRAKSDTATMVSTATTALISVNQADNKTAATSATNDIVTSNAQDQGPWSKLEAYLLFDTWPAAKEKGKPIYKSNPSAMATSKTGPPNDRTRIHADLEDDENDDDLFANDSDIHLSLCTARSVGIPPFTVSGNGGGGSSRNIGTRKPQSLPGIRSARSVLRDEM